MDVSGAAVGVPNKICYAHLERRSVRRAFAAAARHKQQQHCYVSILVTQQCRRESAKKARVLISVMTRLINHYDSLVNVINIILARLTKHLIFASNHARRTPNKMPVNLNISFFGPTGSS